MNKTTILAAAAPVLALLASCTPPGPADPHGGHSTSSSAAASQSESSTDHSAQHGSESGTGATYMPGENIRVSQLPLAAPSRLMDVRDGDVIRIDPLMVRRTIDGAEVFQYAYNGQIPGPTIRAEQGTTFTVVTTNRIDLPTTIHWHGVRLQSRFDGTPGMSQDPIRPTETFRYEVTVPDDGVFWYHPHMREDVQLDLGLFGNIVVLPEGQSLESTPAPLTLALDDILLQDDGSLMPYGKDGENYSLMGRFGNLLLANGAPKPRLSVDAGTQRLYITNVANVRTFRLSIDGASMKVIGGDVGFGIPYEPDEIVIGPAERVIVDVTFPAAGEYALLHRSPTETSTVATFAVRDPNGIPATASPADDLPGDIASHRSRAPDKTLRISLNGGHRHGNLDETGIEWEDSMPELNAGSHRGNTEWRLVDDDTGKINMQIAWRFTRGQLVKIRLKSDFESMQHPIHFHGQRFLVIASNGKDVDDGQWKDTYLLRAGETADIVLEASNPGWWMFHCHIAEHLQNGMMGTFFVE